MKEIQLTQGYVALVDDEDFERVNQYKWHANVDHRKDGTINTVYAQRNLPDLSKKSKQTVQQMHRFILGIADPAVEVDHEDHAGLNNQRHNLQPATHKQNGQRKKLNPRNTSGYKGVSWHKQREKWVAYIKMDGKLMHLGLFLDPLEAACTYDMAAVKYFGEFAHCNFAEAS